MEQTADRTEAAVVDHYFLSPTENILSSLPIDTGIQTDDCFVMHSYLPVYDAIQILQLQLQLNDIVHSNTCMLCVLIRHWRIWQEYVHQTDANNSWQWLLG